MTEKSSAECEAAIQRFSEITECDEAFAHSILQDVNYDLEAALAKYFSGQVADADPGTAAAVAAVISEGKSNTLDDDDEVGEFDFDYDDDTNDDDDGQRTQSSSGDEATADTTTSSSAKQKTVEKKRCEEMPMELTMMTWNVDGLDTGNLDKRFTAVLYVIAKKNPEVIFLQEVVAQIMPKLMDLMDPMYHIFISDPDFPYFCVTLVSKNIRIISEEVIPFSNTSMGRGMIVVEAEWHKLKLKLINSHLESMADYSAQRKVQLGMCIDKLMALSGVSDGGGGDPSKTAVDEETMAIFGGDLNVRDAEIPVLPPGVKDAWIEDGGGKKETKFTWDMRRNDNKQAGGARLRFDRVYYRGGPFRQVDFSLEGTQRIRGVHRFPSDHFAISCRFHDIVVRQDDGTSPSATKSK